MTERAKAVIADHERLFEAGDVDDVMTNFADDAALVALESPVVEGKEALRAFYKQLLDVGHWRFRHDYSGADVSGDCVFLYGVAYGAHTPADGSEPFTFANNFLIVLKQIEGRLLAWRAAFMPGASE